MKGPYGMADLSAWFRVNMGLRKKFSKLFKRRMVHMLSGIIEIDVHGKNVEEAFKEIRNRKEYQALFICTAPELMGKGEMIF